MDISAFLESQTEDIIDAACTAMDRTHLEHYERDGVLKTRERIAMLYSLAKQCVKQRNLAPMIAYAEQIATERYTAGFDLWEVQTAFNVLEEAIWGGIFKSVQPAELAQTLGLISTVLGAGKDALARKYVSLASKTKAPSMNLQSLFSGAAG
jgi:hypothetical protein